MLKDEYEAQLAALNQRSADAAEVAKNDLVPFAIRAKALEIMSQCLVDTCNLQLAAMRGEVVKA